MKKILIFIIIISIFGIVGYFSKNITKNLLFIGEKPIPTIHKLLGKAKKLNNTGINITTLTGKNQINNNIDIKTISERLQKSLIEYQTEDSYIILKGNIENIRHTKAVNKIGIVACKGNLGTVYGNVYILKNYEYPLFEYKIKQKYNNVCRIPYKIIFYDKNNTEIITREIKILEKDTKKIIN